MTWRQGQVFLETNFLSETWHPGERRGPLLPTQTEKTSPEGRSVNCGSAFAHGYSSRTRRVVVMPSRQSHSVQISLHTLQVV